MDLFESTVVIDKDIYLELKRYLMSKKDKRTYAIIMLSILIVVGGLLVLQHYEIAVVAMAFAIGLFIRYIRHFNMII